MHCESSGIRDPPSTKPDDPLLDPFDSMATMAVSCQTPLLKKDLCITLMSQVFCYVGMGTRNRIVLRLSRWIKNINCSKA